jgi:hypothetical protein
MYAQQVVASGRTLDFQCVGMSKEDVAANPNFDQIDYCKHDEDEESKKNWKSN